MTCISTFSYQLSVRVLAAASLCLAFATGQSSEGEVQYRRGVTLLREKKFAEAAGQLEAAARLSPGVAPVWLAVAHARLETGRVAEARAAAAEARKLGAADSNIARGLATFYRQLAKKLLAAREPSGAVEAWQEAIALAPGDASPYAELAGLFLDHRTPEPAIAVLTAALARIPNDADLLRLQGLAHYAAGENAKAIEAFLRLMDLAPDAEESYTTVETLLPEAGDQLPGITARLRRYSSARPSSPVGHFLLAQALAVSEPGTSQIETLLREAIRVEPKFWPAHFEVHKALLARGAVRDAAGALERAVELNPDYAPARYALAQVYAALEDRIRAAAERRAHHALVTREREAAQARTAAMPPLPYKLLKR